MRRIGERLTETPERRRRRRRRCGHASKPPKRKLRGEGWSRANACALSEHLPRKFGPVPWTPAVCVRVRVELVRRSPIAWGRA